MEKSLYDVLTDAGLVLAGELIQDGEIHRCGTIKKPRSKNGWYACYEGKAAVFGNWEAGDHTYKWFAGNVTDVDRAQLSAKIERTKQKKKDEQARVASDCQEYFYSLPTDGFSFYLKNKKCFPHGARFDGDRLVVPVMDVESGEIISLQTIHGNGDKLYRSGGRVQGGYFLISGGRNISKNDKVIVCEGFATGASIHQATGAPVAVAFTAYNIKAVADKLPFRNITIAADNDKSGIGEKYAKDSGYPYVMPDVVGWDFSDVYLEGIDLAKYFDIHENDSKGFPELYGLVGEIADWITKTAIKPRPILSAAAALSFVGMMKGHRVCGNTDLRTNLLTLAMLPTAGGKEHPQKCLRSLARACGMEKHMMGEPTSGSGFLRGVEAGGNVSLLLMDEVGRWLGNITSRNAGVYQNEIVDYIIKTFSCANSVLYGKQFADPKKNPRIDLEQPHFCCFGSTIREKFISSCKASDIIDGFLNRWLVFDDSGHVEINKKAVKSEPPEYIVDLVKENSGGVYDDYGNPTPKTVYFSPESLDIFNAYSDKMEKKTRETSYPLNALYPRCHEHVRKIALILCDDDIILMRDVNTAIALVDYSLQSVLDVTGLIADTDTEAEYLRVADIIKNNGDIQRNHLTRKCQFLRNGSRRLNEILGVLEENHQIAKRQDGKKVLYKWIGKA